MKSFYFIINLVLQIPAHGNPQQLGKGKEGYEQNLFLKNIRKPNIVKFFLLLFLFSTIFSSAK